MCAVLSNCDSISSEDTVKRYDRTKREHVEISRPGSIKHYNAHMGGVDYLDRGVAEYRIRMKSKKWWYPHFTNTLSVLLFSSWKLFKIGNPDTPLDFLRYLREVVCSYLDESKAPPVTVLRPRLTPRPSDRRSGWRIEEATRLNGGQHWPVKFAGYGLRCGGPTCNRRVRVSCKVCTIAY